LWLNRRFRRSSLNAFLIVLTGLFRNELANATPERQAAIVSATLETIATPVEAIARSDSCDQVRLLMKSASFRPHVTGFLARAKRPPVSLSARRKSGN
jgi:hypothetical protein